MDPSTNYTLLPHSALSCVLFFFVSSVEAAHDSVAFATSLRVPFGLYYKLLESSVLCTRGVNEKFPKSNVMFFRMVNT